MFILNQPLSNYGTAQSWSSSGFCGGVPVCGGELAAVSVAICCSVRLKLKRSKSCSRKALFVALGITGIPC